MVSSASTVIRMELMATTENSGTWGSKTNTNLQMLESAVAGVFSISTTGGTTTLADVDYTNDDAKNRTLDVTGALVSDATIVIPNRKRMYRVFNRTSGSFAVKVKTSGGSSITVTQSTVVDVQCDGSNVCYFSTPMTNYTTGAPSTASGAAASSVSFTPTGNTSSTNVQAAITELQGDIDTINSTLTSSYQPLAARLTDLSSVAATKGNIYVGSGTNIIALAVGTDGYVPVAKAAATGGISWSALIPSGTVSLFYQAAAPTGWTGSNADNDKDIRIVNTSGAAGGSSGGTTAYSSIMAARTISASNIPNMTFTVTDPGHTHTINNFFETNVNLQGGSRKNPVDATDVGAAAPTTNLTNSTATTGISVAWGNTARGGAQTTIDFAVQYINVIKASKDAY